MAPSNADATDPERGLNAGITMEDDSAGQTRRAGRPAARRLVFVWTALTGKVDS